MRVLLYLCVCAACNVVSDIQLAAEDEQGCGTRIRGALGCATANPSLPDEDARLSAGFLISWVKVSMKDCWFDQWAVCALYFFHVLPES